MAKVLEGPGMDLLTKWGMKVPNHIVVTSLEQFDHLASANAWLSKERLVAKAHEAIGSRMKLGLVKVDLDIKGARSAAKKILGQTVGTMTISQAIISEMVPHEVEYYLAVKSTREGADILMANFGGIEVESRWSEIKRTTVEIGEVPTSEALEKLAKEAGFKGDLIGKMAQFARKLFECYNQEDGQYLEINPLSVTKDGELIALDMVTMLDADARFRHPDWNFTFASEFGRPYTEPEREIMEIDTRIKGSVKFIEIPGGSIALLPAGGGASVYYADAIVSQGGKIANYAEYSGDPPDWAVEALTERVCSLPGLKHVIVGGAIANFTNVKKTFAGIIAGFRNVRAKGKLKNVHIWVRRGGPYEKEGLEAMRALEQDGFKIHVYDRYTPLTDIVDYAIKEKQGKK
ncbi:MAG: ATP citrate lyase [Nitrospirae bacterium RIFCSPLOW2_12_42_9]|uniref:ATP-citrate lyase, beta subunit n=1 Tax=Candidatus Uhrbacteria bacterium GW2011_GWF2_41_16 TaxID=1618997 RepID=A0A0G0V851_9BACT|nr:MAG: ATP-citrate lyase, beta subunit [Candidatus Uhrbacteria bacterium GW2011_GWF2_41_16]OGW16370.1 MAG: ATP citrate lyase [Nitrospirae bacterium GWA2_42_11]OGW57534.1 MAG: ATP citrate lyase [Nitrospirae bacterium RIFCSPLOW2_12_42_9]OGW58288.1 MAG: ATP citrate lyase [Nitrospirae bacterium RIFCSPHIGHO2_02_FULL_42_12]HAS17223.1 ATP citrate lyase [Nitrospiraceae bacterium]